MAGCSRCPRQRASAGPARPACDQLPSAPARRGLQRVCVGRGSALQGAIEHPVHCSCRSLASGGCRRPRATASAAPLMRKPRAPRAGRPPGSPAALACSPPRPRPPAAASRLRGQSQRHPGPAPSPSSPPSTSSPPSLPPEAPSPSLSRSPMRINASFIACSSDPWDVP